MATKEKTFNAFTAKQAAAYATARGYAYPRRIYDSILEYHGDSTRDVLLDVGTGPGKVVWDLGNDFIKALGCDSSSSMIEQAKQDATRKDLKAVTDFTVCTAEHCADAFPSQKVDVLTVAMAVHWFDLPVFYASAARALRPGGTLALWTTSSAYVHPTVPNHAELQQILFDLEDNMLQPYTVEGNRLSRNAYVDLALPWNISENAGLFDEAAFKRVDWDRDGIPSAPSLPDGTPGPFLHSEKVPIAAFGAAISSASMVIRWREAHPDMANTDEDPVNITVKRLIAANDGKPAIYMSSSMTLLLLRRSWSAGIRDHY